MLLLAGVFAQAMDQDTIHDAAATGDVAVLQRFLEHDPNLLNQPDRLGWTPLHCAVYCGKEVVVRLLCNQPGIRTNQQDECGRAPLLWAALFNHERIMRLLLLRGATPIDNPYVKPLINEVQRIRADWHRAQLSIMMGLHPRTGVRSPLREIYYNIRQIQSYLQEDFQEIVLAQATK